MNQFDKLPPEIIEFIFKKVYFSDLINLRIVDKRFKEICEQIKIKQLNVSYENCTSLSSFYENYICRSFCVPKFWFYTNDPTYSNKENQTMISKFLNYKSIFKLDKYLRRLAIYGEFNISILNEFKLLEHLEMKTEELNDNYKLNLENLKILSIHITASWKLFKLTLDTNQLFAFNSSHFKLNHFVFDYPEKILFYEMNYYDNYDKIKEFINLEYLKINCVSNSIDIDILSKCKNLKILDLHIHKSINQDEFDDLKEDIISILDEKKNLKRSEFNIYLFGVKIINQNQIDQLKFSDDYYIEFNNNVLEFQLKNYDLLKDNCYMNAIEYCDLIKLIKIIPSSFKNKFPFIQNVYANDHIDNEDQFIKFLYGLPYLYELVLINCELPKSFYNKLINLVYLNNLENLIIKDKEDLGLNFDFILNLKQLKLFDTNQKINNHNDLISKLFKENQNIQQFTFKFDTKKYKKINKYNFTCFKIDSFYLDDNLEEIKNFLFFATSIVELVSLLNR